MRGTLCAPRDAKVLQLLLHGYTYDRHYWQFPHKPATYSYARAANQRGYATLAIDRLGSGQSTHPPSAAVTYQANADAVHQVIQAARAGKFGTTYEKIVLVGHSFGSMTSYLEAGQYQDVNAVIATGAGRDINVPAAGVIAAGLKPAILDPKFASAGLDPGYVTLSRSNHKMFFNQANAEADVVDHDYEFRQASSLVEISTGLPYSITSNAARINVPVLTINGSEDPLFCGPPTSQDCSSSKALARSQQSFFGAHATVEGSVIQGGGHSFNLERTAPKTFDEMLDFSERHVAP
ncbi:hypothetical protein AN218_22475 [Streptomyces nanshensis]|uniref:AB hydrolase-1 domain-containing protein n=1 Tax=Streptomyces nanshensis TaxID=518642 RepID=A0A1E7KZF3_9ACTN|nr:hypothetical protein AN218_22475 [Streptomyces nanshensis]